MYIVLAILLFSFLIFVHEGGHFVTAKLCGVQVNEFSMFMGPAIFQKQVGETTYSLRCIPFGGFCAMEGEDGESENPRSFAAAAWWKRILILVAGAAMNFLVGVLLMTLVVGIGPGKAYIDPVISGYDEGSTLIGENALQVGDRLLELDGQKIYVQSDFSLLLQLNPGEIHDVTVERDGERLEIPDVVMRRQEFPQEDGTTRLLYGIHFTLRDLDFGSTLRLGWRESLDSIRIAWVSLKMLLTGQAGVGDMVGPVGIVSQINETAKTSENVSGALLDIAYFGGFLTINLAVMNLLPIPALDGGRAVCVLLTTGIEKVTRKKLNPKYEAYVNGAAMILLLGFMALISLKDIFTIFKR